jgi:hypothetical protein
MLDFLLDEGFVNHFPRVGLDLVALGGENSAHIVQPPQSFQPAVDQGPGAILFSTHLALAVICAATRPVDQALGAYCYGTDAACEMQHAFAASPAPLYPRPVTFVGTHELSIESGIDGLFGKQYGRELHPNAACSGKDSIITRDDFFDRLEVLPIALSLDGSLIYLNIFSLFFIQHPELFRKNGHFFFPTGHTDRHACAASQYQDITTSFKHLLYLLQWFALSNDHLLLQSLLGVFTCLLTVSPERIGPQLSCSFGHGPHGIGEGVGHGRRQIKHFQSLGLQSYLLKKLFGVTDPTPRPLISFQEMAFSLQSAGHEDSVSAPIQGFEEIDWLDFPGAHYLNYANIGWILEPHGSGKVGSRVCAVLAAESRYLWFEFRHS